MFWTGINHTVLTGIPEEMIHFTDSNSATYTNLDESNQIAADAAAFDPASFSYFCAINPHDFDALEKIEKCMNEGAVGIKFYDGYKAYHTLALDNVTMLDLIKKVDEMEGILLLPVSTSNYQTELENMLKLNSDLPVICSHYCLSSKNLERLTGLMSTYKNLYIDTSFGFIDYALDGFNTITANNDAFRDFFDEYQDRILFATDNVITGYENKDKDWLIDLYADYISILSEDEFASKSNPGTTYLGLDLSKGQLKKIFQSNWDNLIEQ